MKYSMNHPVMGDVKCTSVSMPEDPDGQVAHALALMSRYAIADSQSDAVYQDSVDAVQEGNGDIIRGAWLMAKRKIIFTEDQNVLTDPGIVEVLIRPVDVSVMSRSGPGSVIGDCDDFSMYVASLLLAQNVPCCFATVAADPKAPENYSHVYVVAYPPDGRIAVDASHGAYPGWEAPNMLGRMKEWDLYEAAGSGGSSVILFLGAALLSYMWFSRKNRSIADD